MIKLPTPAATVLYTVAPDSGDTAVSAEPLMVMSCEAAVQPICPLDMAPVLHSSAPVAALQRVMTLAALVMKRPPSQRTG
jgi:hypothetical protein